MVIVAPPQRRGAGPYWCEQCGGSHDGSYGSGRFCDLSCRSKCNGRSLSGRNSPAGGNPRQLPGAWSGIAGGGGFPSDFGSSGVRHGSPNHFRGAGYTSHGSSAPRAGSPSGGGRYGTSGPYKPHRPYASPGGGHRAPLSGTKGGSPKTSSPKGGGPPKVPKVQAAPGDHSCEHCGTGHDGSYGSGRFCSQGCRSRANGMASSSASPKGGSPNTKGSPSKLKVSPGK